MQQFLDVLRGTPTDLVTWLVYADWLDERDDPTGSFVRLSLELTAGRVEMADLGTRLDDFEKLYDLSHAETRELLATYRSTLPTRFRVLDTLHIGHDPPREMFADARSPWDSLRQGS
jgi:uncharacterized protein (TIGR02996 family)